MKQCILTGGGSKFGAKLTESFLDRGYFVHLITSNGNNWKSSSQLNVIDVDWKNLEISKLRTLIPNVDHIDVVLFNHNASALSSLKFLPNSLQTPRDWQHSYFVACQFPYYLIHALAKKLNAESKISWMLSELIKYPVVDQIGYADYIGNKFTNACIMKNFSISHPSCFFGLHPDGGLENDHVIKATNMVKLIDTTDADSLNGNIFDSQGNTLDIFLK